MSKAINEKINSKSIGKGSIKSGKIKSQKYPRQPFRNVRAWFKKGVQEKRAFIYSLALTFSLAVVLITGNVLFQIDQLKSANPNLQTNDLPFKFYECVGLNLWQFVFAKVVETMVPTAVTFSATVLCLQANPAKKQGWFIFLLVAIVLLVVFGIVLPTAKTLDFLIGYLITLGCIYFFSLLSSWKAFSAGDSKQQVHKQEEDDGSIVS